MDAVFDYGVYEIFLPVTWIDGIVTRIEPHTNYYLKELKAMGEVSFTF